MGATGMICKATVAGLCGLGFSASVAFGFSTDGSTLIRSFDKSLSPTNQPITVTVTFTNGGSNDLRGFFYTDQVPSSLSVTTLGVTLNGAAITNFMFESGRDGDVHAGCTPCRWVLESPTNFAEAHPIPPQGSLQITYALTATMPGNFAFQEFSWAGYQANLTNACFGFSEAADQQTANFVKAILTVTADNHSRIYGVGNPPLTVSYSGFVSGDDTNSLSGNPAVNTTVSADSPPGSYPITVAQGTLTGSGYAFNFVNGTLVIVSPPIQIASVQVINGVATITWNSVAGQTYRVQYKNGLADPNWTDLPPDVTATGPTASKTDVVGTLPQRIYRVTLAQILPAPVPVLQSIALTNGLITVVWSSVPGQTYRVQYDSSLVATNWTDLLPDVTATGTTASKTDAIGDVPQRFYRVLFTQPLVLPPVIQSLNLNSGVVTLVWSSVAGQKYRVQHKDQLTNAIWTELPIDVTATGPMAGTTDLVGSSPHRFYRVLAQRD